jgi:hypothetical protein
LTLLLLDIAMILNLIILGDGEWGTKSSRICVQIKNVVTLFCDVFMTFCDIRITSCLFMIFKLTPCVSKSMDFASMDVYDSNRHIKDITDMTDIANMTDM